MNTWVVEDRKTGRIIELEGDAAPSDADLDEIFDAIPSLSSSPPQPSARPLSRGELARSSIEAEIDRKTAEAAPDETWGKALVSFGAAEGRSFTDTIQGGARLLGLGDAAAKLLSPLTSSIEEAEFAAEGMKGNEILSAVTGTLGSSAASVVLSALPGGAVVSAGAAGLQGFESTRRDALKLILQAGVAPDEAERIATRVGLQAGVITGAVTGAFNRYAGKLGLGKGVERGLSSAVRELTAKELQRTAAIPIVKAVLKEAGGEGLEEGTDTLLQETITRWQYDPSTSLAEYAKRALADILKAGALGTVAGGVVGGGGAAAQVVGERRVAVARLRAGDQGPVTGVPGDTSALATPMRIPEPTESATPADPAKPDAPGTYVFGTLPDGREVKVTVPEGGDVKTARDYMAKAMPEATFSRVEVVASPEVTAPTQGANATAESGGATSDASSVPAPEAPPASANEEVIPSEEEGQRKEVLTPPDAAAASTPAAPPKRRRIARAAIGDILDDIEQAGGLMSRTEAEARGFTVGPEWDDAPQGLPVAHRFIFGNGAGGKGTLTPDKALQALQGQFPEKYGGLTVPEMWAAIEAASNGRVAATKRRKAEIADTKAAIDWEQSALEPGANTEGVLAGDLGVGEVLTIDGEKVRVKGYDRDGNVILDDGKRFGRQRVDGGQIIYAEKIEAAGATGQKVQQSPDAPFSIGQQGFFDAPESVEEQKARMAREEAARKKAADRQKMLDRQAAPLRGRAVDTTGDMFDPSASEAPLFATRPPTKPTPARGQQGELFSVAPAPDNGMLPAQVEGELRRAFGGRMPSRVVVSGNAPRVGGGVAEAMLDKKTGTVTIFAPNLRNADDVRRVARHEFLHDVFEDGQVQGAWRTLRTFLTGAATARVRGEGYTENVDEEALIDEIEARVDRQAGPFRRFIGRIVDALGRRGRQDIAGALFGLDHLADADARALVGYAMRVDRMEASGRRRPGWRLSLAPEYQGSHRPNSDGPPAHDLLSGGLAPSDVYTSPQFYSGYPDSQLRQTMRALRAVRGKPEAAVLVYRAGPSAELNTGDWVTLSEDYARQHAKHPTDPSQDMEVHRFKVPAESLRWALDDLMEFGYFGNPVKRPAQGADSRLSIARRTPETQTTEYGNATVTGPAVFSIRAYHGTPHKVDRFSTEKIGTGQTKRRWSDIEPYLTDAEKNKAHTGVQKSIARIIETLPTVTEFAAAAAAGLAKKGWYRKSAQALVVVFRGEAPRFAALLAALSPQTSVESNLTNALQVWAGWEEAGRPTDRATIVRIMGENVIGKGTEASVLQAWVNNSVAALTSDSPDTLVLSGPKVNSFAANLRGIMNEITNDTWMANFSLIRQALFGGSKNKSGPGKGSGYKAMNAVVRETAEFLERETGETWSPAEVQETVWSFTKALVEMSEATGIPAGQILETGALTDSVIAETPDFATLLSREPYRSILEGAGLQVPQADPESGGRSDSAATLSKIPGGHEALRVTARRLENLAAYRAQLRGLTAELSAAEKQQQDRPTKTGAERVERLERRIKRLNDAMRGVKSVDFAETRFSIRPVTPDARPARDQSSEPNAQQSGQGSRLSLRTLWRAGDADEVGIKPWASFTEDKATAEAYLDNPGFGGETLRSVEADINPDEVLNADTHTRRGMQDLAAKIGLERDVGEEWFDNGWRYPWEESKSVKDRLRESGFKWLRYVDDFPEGASTIIRIVPFDSPAPTQGADSRLSIARRTPETQATEYGNATVTGPAVFSIRAYHGTPHKVDRFSTEKIGTGEGAQAYGWGLYFAEKREVAQGYAEQLGAGNFEYDGKPVSAESDLPNEQSARRIAVELLWSWQGDKDGAMSDADGYDDAKDIKRILKGLDFAKIRRGGRTYSVELDADEDELLDFDRTLAQQSPKVADAVRRAFEAERLIGTDSSPFEWNPRKWTGAQAYSYLARYLGPAGEADEYASNRLLLQGIKGIQYLDEGSRTVTPAMEVAERTVARLEEMVQRDGKQEDIDALAASRRHLEDLRRRNQTRNFVVFDDKFIRIVGDSDTRLSIRNVPADQIAAEPERQKQAGRAPTVISSELAWDGARVMEELNPRGFEAWRDAMLARHGEAALPFLSRAWEDALDVRYSLANGIPPQVQDDIHRIESAADAAPSTTERKPVPAYDPTKVKEWWHGAVRPSDVIRYFGGDDLLRKKNLLDLRTAYQQAAVQEQSRRLTEALEDSFYGDRAGPILRALRRFMPRTRFRRFMRHALPIAAHLNVTGGTSGAWTFADFDQRAGFMPESEANRHGITSGDSIMRANPVTGALETLVLGPKMTLEKGPKGFQILRKMTADRQAGVYQWARAEFPEFMWFLDTWLDPRLKDTRVEINGVELPIFNRWALATRYAQADPKFVAREAYTPDVSIGAGLLGAMKRQFRKERKWSPRDGTVSPGRKYETGTARESGDVLDLLSGFNVRAMQVLQEDVRKQWAKDVLASAADVPPEGLPESWVPIETAMDEVWRAVQAMQKFDDPLNFPSVTDRLRDDDSPEYKKFFGELTALRRANTPKMVPRPLVEALRQDMATTKELGLVGEIFRWWARNWKAALLLMPDTFIENRTDNYLRLLMQSYRQLILAAMRGGDRQAFREARHLAWAAMTGVVPGIRQLTGLNRNRLFNDVVRSALPPELFSSGHKLADLWIDKGGLEKEIASDLTMGRRGRAVARAAANLPAVVLEKSGYSDMDVTAKQQFAFATLLAAAETEGRRRGLHGDVFEQFVEAWVKKPPEAAIRRAVEGANRLLLNYNDTPGWLAKLARNPVSNLLVAFPLFRYHFVGREIDRATSALRSFINVATRNKKLTRDQWAAALADTISYITLPLVGYAGVKVVGALADSLIGAPGGDDDDDPRNVVGSGVRLVETPEGDIARKPLARELVTANRINLSAIMRQMGVDTGNPNDYWWHAKDYPIVRSVALVYQAMEDARRHGPTQGLVSLFGGLKEFLGSIAGVGQVVKVPAKIAAEIEGAQSGRPAFTGWDPYATGVPLDAYLTMQALNLIPGQRQANEVMKWLDPTPRRMTRSKSLDYDPGVREALQAEGWTGLADRMARLAMTGDAASPLPPQGTINRRTGTVDTPRTFDLTSRIAALLGQNIKPVPRDEYRDAVAE